MNGILPRQYTLIRAAKILGCSAIELDTNPEAATWIDWALVSEKADNLIEKAMAKRRSKKGRYEEDD